MPLIVLATISRRAPAMIHQPLACMCRITADYLGPRRKITSTGRMNGRPRKWWRQRDFAAGGGWRCADFIGPRAQQRAGTLHHVTAGKEKSGPEALSPFRQRQPGQRPGAATAGGVGG